MKEYEKYKDSKVAWLGQIPKHWDTLRAKAMFDKQNRPVKEEHDVVTCFRDGMVTLRKNRRITGFTESIKEHGYQGISKGDLVIHVMDAFAGAIGVSDSEGKATPVYSVCTAKGDYNHFYYAHIVRQMAKSGFIQSLFRGVRERSSDFKFDVFAKQYLPIPSPAEQEQIVRYLDWKVAMADKFVREKRREITLLKELRQAEINRAVTRGLDPTVSTKPSGIDWIGDIPEHWQCMALKRLFVDRQSGAWGEEQKNEDGDRICLRIADFNYDILRFKRVDEYTIRNYSIDVINRLSLKKGDILIEKSGGGEKTPVGRAVIFDLDINEAMYANFMDRLRVQKGNDSLFIVYLLNCLYKNGVMWNYIKQTTGIQNLDLSNLLSKESIVNPPIIEQQQIVEHIKTIEANINKAIEKIENEIALTAEYKTRLISDVTTGKVDVRGIEIPDYKIEEATISDNAEIESLVSITNVNFLNT